MTNERWIELMYGDSPQQLTQEEVEEGYFWCGDCDDLLTKKSECCLNRINMKDISENEMLRENMDKLIDYFGQMVMLQGDKKFKCSGKEAYEDAIQVCQNIKKNICKIEF